MNITPHSYLYKRMINWLKTNLLSTSSVLYSTFTSTRIMQQYLESTYIIATLTAESVGGSKHFA